MSPKAFFSPALCLLPLLLFSTILTSQPLLGEPRPAENGPWRIGAIQDVIETPHGNIYKVYRPKTPSRSKTGVPLPPDFEGDSFSFDHQLGALINDVFQCFSVHMSGSGDTNVLFDGITELLDAYLDGTVPAIFESQSNNGDGTSDAFMNSFSDSETDLFPEGFEDPETGMPLTDACVEIGIDDTLDADMPVKVTSAIFEASGDEGSIIPNIDITSFFSDPWDGRMSIVFGGSAGQGINGLTLQLEIEPADDPSTIFADGFESGDASAWTND